MKRVIISFFVVSLACMSLHARTNIRFMPAWTPQSQFAGYYVAVEKGFFAEEGLDVTIEHIGVNSTKAGAQRLFDGEIDIISSDPTRALLDSQNGTRLVNVLQVSQNSSLMIVSHTHLKGLDSINGMKVGRWKSAFNEVSDMCSRVRNLDVQWIPFLNGINLFVSEAIDATLAMSYNEYLSLLEAGFVFSKDQVVRFSDFGYNIPEDGLYVSEKFFNDHKEDVQKFCKAAMRGWIYCLDHREEAVDIVMQYVDDNLIQSSRFHQKSMLDEMLKLLVNPDSKKVDFQPIRRRKFDELVKTLLNMGFLSSPVSYDEFVK